MLDLRSKYHTYHKMKKKKLKGNKYQITSKYEFTFVKNFVLLLRISFCEYVIINYSQIVMIFTGKYPNENMVTN